MPQIENYKNIWQSKHGKDAGQLEPNIISFWKLKYCQLYISEGRKHNTNATSEQRIRKAPFGIMAFEDSAPYNPIFHIDFASP